MKIKNDGGLPSETLKVVEALDEFVAGINYAYQLKRKQLINNPQERIASADISDLILSQNPPQRQDSWYQDSQMKFRLASGNVDQFDFSKAEVSRKIFEAFWRLWESNNKGEYTLAEIRDKYRQEFGSLPLNIGGVVSNIRTSIIQPKTSIRDRIHWYFRRPDKIWIFRILPLKH